MFGMRKDKKKDCIGKIYGKHGEISKIYDDYL